MDICSGKSSLQKCSAKTIWQLAKALQCTMEDILAFERKEPVYDEETGLPANREYLERKFLRTRRGICATNISGYTEGTVYD